MFRAACVIHSQPKEFWMSSHREPVDSSVTATVGIIFGADKSVKELLAKFTEKFFEGEIARVKAEMVHAESKVVTLKESLKNMTDKRDLMLQSITDSQPGAASNAPVSESDSGP